ncbi:MAG: hypothetical protein ACO1OB_15050 [Archangium sp.]
MKRLLFVSLAALFASCNPCNAICVGQIKFILTEREATDFAATPSSVKVCVDGTCFTRDSELLKSNSSLADSYDATTRTISVRNDLEPNAATGRVTLTVMRESTQVFRHEWDNVEFREYAPNGEACGPVCFAAGPLSSP